MIQTALEVVRALGMGRSTRQSEELVALVGSMDRPDGIALVVEHMAVTTPVALAVQATLTRMDNAVPAARRSTTNIETACSEIATKNQDLSVLTEQIASNLQRTANRNEALTN